MLHIDYFNTIINNIEKAEKLTPKLIKEYKEFRRQFDIAKRYGETIEKPEVEPLEKRFYRMDLLIHKINNEKGK